MFNSQPKPIRLAATFLLLILLLLLAGLTGCTRTLPLSPAAIPPPSPALMQEPSLGYLRNAQERLSDWQARLINSQRR